MKIIEQNRYVVKEHLNNMINNNGIIVVFKKHNEKSNVMCVIDEIQKKFKSTEIKNLTNIKELEDILDLSEDKIIVTVVELSEDEKFTTKIQKMKNENNVLFNLNNFYNKICFIAS